jgi:hypothetical protein
MLLQQVQQRLFMPRAMRNCAAGGLYICTTFGASASSTHALCVGCGKYLIDVYLSSVALHTWG